MQKRVITLQIAMLVIGAVFILLSCRDSRQPAENIFRYNESTGISTLDPAFARNQALIWPVHQLYNTLVEYDDQLRLRPSLATSWEFSPDRCSILFRLRRDVRFHDDPCFPQGKGRFLVAQDVLFSFQRIVDPATASPGAWIFNGIVDSVQPFVAVNDSCFLLRLNRPFVPVLGILTMSYCSIIPKEAVMYYGNSFRAHPVGTGPFSLLAWKEGQALILTKNNHYFEKDSLGKALPYLDGIHVSFFESKSTEFMEFSQGRLDFINDVDPSFKDVLLTRAGNLRKEWQQKIRLEKGPYLNTEYLGFLTESGNSPGSPSWLSHPQVRKAMRYSIDLNRLMFQLRNSLGTAATAGFVPPVLLPHVGRVHHAYDPQKTRDLLKAAGVTIDQNQPVTLKTVPAYADIGSFIATELSAAGIPVKVEVMPKSLLLQEMSNSMAFFFRGSWIADYPDPQNFFSVFYGEHPTPPNYTRFDHPVFNRLYEAALVETNDSIRKSHYLAMDSLLMEELPVIPLWYDMTIHFYQKNVSGTLSDPRNMLELRRVRKY